MKHILIVLTLATFSLSTKAQTEKYAVYNSLLQQARTEYKHVDSTVVSAKSLPLFRRPDDTSKIFNELQKVASISRQEFDQAVANADDRRLDISKLEKVDRIATTFSYPLDVVMTTHKGKKKVTSTKKAPIVLFCSFSAFVYFPTCHMYLMRFSSATGSTYGGACYYLLRKDKSILEVVKQLNCVAY